MTGTYRMAPEERERVAAPFGQPWTLPRSGYVDPAAREAEAGSIFPARGVEVFLFVSLDHSAEPLGPHLWLDRVCPGWTKLSHSGV